MKNAEREIEARRKASALLDNEKQRREEALKARDRERQADAAKVTRLRELRLAKEAADRETAKTAPISRRKTTRA